MNWNKEKMLFAASLVVLVLVVGLAFKQLGSDTDMVYRDIDYTQGSTVTGGDYVINWVRVEPGSGRDPFDLVSDWGGGERDMLPPPPLGALKRRVPLPTLLADSREALPPRETRMPRPDDAPSENPWEE